MFKFADVDAWIALGFDLLSKLLLVQAREIAASAAEKQEAPPPGSMEIASFEEFMQHGSSSKASKRKNRSENKQYAPFFLRGLHLHDVCIQVAMRPSPIRLEVFDLRKQHQSPSGHLKCIFRLLLAGLLLPFRQFESPH